MINFREHNKTKLSKIMYNSTWPKISVNCAAKLPPSVTDF